jgi:hypothetical protein
MRSCCVESISSKDSGTQRNRSPFVSTLAEMWRQGTTTGIVSLVLAILAAHVLARDVESTLLSLPGIKLDNDDPELQKLMQTVESILPDQLSQQCANPNCNCVNGRCDEISATCICDPGWTDPNCNTTILYWVEMLMHGVVPDARAYSAFGTFDNKFLVAGGVIKFEDIFSRTMDFYVMDIPTLTWKKLPLTEDHPNGRSDAAYFVYEDKFYMFGGVDVLGAYRSDMSYVSIGDGVWSQVHADDAYPNATCNGEVILPPSARARSSFALVGNEVYLWGGVHKDDSGSKTFFQEFHVYSLTLKAWVKVPGAGGLAPCPRAGHSLTVVGNKLYLFGGGTYNNEYLNDIHAFNLGLYSLLDHCFFFFIVFFVFLL